MPRKIKGYVLDKKIVLDFFEDEPPAPKIAEIISSAHDEELPLCISVIDLAELWSTVAFQRTIKDAEEMIRDLQEIGISIIEVDWPVAQDALRINKEFKLDKEKCFCLALAKKMKFDLLTTNDEYQNINVQVNIHWIQ